MEGILAHSDELLTPQMHKVAPHCKGNCPGIHTILNTIATGATIKEEKYFPLKTNIAVVSFNLVSVVLHKIRDQLWQ